MKQEILYWLEKNNYLFRNSLFYYYFFKSPKFNFSSQSGISLIFSPNSSSFSPGTNPSSPFTYILVSTVPNLGFSSNILRFLADLAIS